MAWPFVVLSWFTAPRLRTWGSRSTCGCFLIRCLTILNALWWCAGPTSLLNLWCLHSRAFLLLMLAADIYMTVMVPEAAWKHAADIIQPGFIQLVQNTNASAAHLQIDVRPGFLISPFLSSTSWRPNFPSVEIHREVRIVGETCVGRQRMAWNVDADKVKAWAKRA